MINTNGRPIVTMGKSNIPPCGAYCEACKNYGRECAGCVETNGKPFFLKEIGLDVCPVWWCVEKRGVGHCGNCEDFPSGDFLNWYDPARGIVTSLRRAGLLALRKRIGDNAWVKWVKEKKIEFGG
ncbi:MAG: DUF3795 domain-containing protein [Thermoproteota archaeon]